MKLATAIITRNMPDFADELFVELDGIGDGMYFLENGTSEELVSKHANICFSESNGVSFAVNHVVQRAIDDGYDLVWISFNDARVNDPKGFADWSIRMFEANPALAVTTAYWPNIWTISGAENPSPGKQSVSNIVAFFDPISFVVSTAAAKKISQIDKRLTPFWDSGNFGAHFNILAPATTLYDAGYFMACNSSFVVTEKNAFTDDDKEEKSLLIRGYTDSDWKFVEGPKEINRWFSDYFPECDKFGNRKVKRAALINRMELAWKKSPACGTVKLLK